MEIEDVLKLEMAAAMQCYFEAALQGWAGDGRAVAVPEMPGYKQFVYKKGDFRVVDRYGSIGEKSTGTTTIWLENKTIWFMSYMGHYRKEDLPFLKRILRKSYEDGEFRGGRGPLGATMGSLVYTNRVSEGSSFRGFRGEESICDPHGIRGGHAYWGAEVKAP